MPRRASERSTAALGVLLVALASASACSGEAFHYAPDVSAGSGSDAGAGGSSGNVSGSGGTSSAGQSGSPDLSDPGTLSNPVDAGGAEQPVASACGFPRVPDPELKNDEVCLGPAELSMGSSEPNLGGQYADHLPPHNVSLSPFFIDAYEVTVARYRACVDAGACSEPRLDATQGCTYTSAPGARELFPVTCVNWSEADTFCDWEGRRLVTEAEWELAARGEEARRDPWGDDVECNRAVLSGSAQCPEHAGQLPKRVGSMPRGASPEGVYDLTGNAWEWVHDRAGSYSTAEQQDPQGPTFGTSRVQRGGAWLTVAAGATGWVRSSVAAAADGPFSLRCARDVE
ncbi:MAG: formylglycine-generating enzyme family protein [Polyangiaceae bacterium]